MKKSFQEIRQKEKFHLLPKSNLVMIKGGGSMVKICGGSNSDNETP